MKNLFPATFTPVDKRSAEEVRTSSLAVTEQDRFMCPVTFKTFARNTKVCQATCVCQTVSKPSIDATELCRFVPGLPIGLLTAESEHGVLLVINGGIWQ